MFLRSFVKLAIAFQSADRSPEAQRALDQRLIWSIGVISLEEVRRLLGEGADANARGNDGLTVLQSAAFRGFWEAVQPLIRAGANIHAKSSSGLNALHYAAVNGHTDVLQSLIDAGLGVDEKDSYLTMEDHYERTALHYAALEGHEEAVQLLIDNGASIDKKSANGRRALHYAAIGGSGKVVQTLIRSGADIYVKDSANETALHLASSPEASLALTSEAIIRNRARNLRIAITGSMIGSVLTVSMVALGMLFAASSLPFAFATIQCAWVIVTATAIGGAAGAIIANTYTISAEQAVEQAYALA